MKTQKANLSCCLYYIYLNDYSALDYDIFLEGRYYNTMLKMRKDIDNLPTKREREEYSTK